MSKNSDTSSPERQSEAVSKSGSWFAGAGKLALKAVLPLAFVGAASAGLMWLRDTKPEVPARPVVERSYAVNTLAIELTDHRPELTLYGTAVAARRAELRALVAGEVVWMNPALQEGGVVAEGEQLLRVDRFDYQGALREAKANRAEAEARLNEISAKIALEMDLIESARTQLEIAERDLARVEELTERGALSQKSADDRLLVVTSSQEALSQRENQLDIDRARAVQQQAVIDRLDWKVTYAERNLDNTVLNAPFDAAVTSANAERGRLLSINDVVATLIDRRFVDVRFTLTDNQYGRIADESGSVTGRDVTVTWRAGGVPRSFPAIVQRVIAEIESTRGGVDVFARIDESAFSAGSLLLRPGAFVEVAIADQVYRDAARVPATALYGTDKVFVIRDGRLAARTVQIIGRSGDDLLIRGALSDGDRVIVTRITEAGEGLKVEDLSLTAPVADEVSVR
ncbi:MAG: efflux RND transporter periplasmic adaptor subunit [Pseudomonadota bacterium]